MYFLIYLSTASIPLTDQQLSDILTKSRINNSKQDITGLLLYHDGSIIQVLEGDKEIVQNLYAIISNDTRHAGAISMLEGESEQRNFPDWSMGFKSISNQDWAPFTGYFALNRSELQPKLNTDNKSIITVINSFMRVNIGA